MTSKSAALGLWSREHMKCEPLFVEPEVAGRQAAFPLGEFDVLIKLPNAPVGEEKRSRGIEVGSYRINPYQPIYFQISSVEIFASRRGSKIRVPGEILSGDKLAATTRFFRASDLLERTAAEYQSVARRGFDVWKRMLRWKAVNWRIGRGSLSEVSGGAELINEADGRHVWSATTTITTPMQQEISVMLWDVAMKDLQAQVDIPLPVDLFFEACHHASLGDIRRAALDAAVAVEVFIRERVAASLPEGLGEAAREVIDTANIRILLNKVYLEATGQSGKSLSKIQELLNIRNDLAHKGSSSALTPERCHVLLEAVRIFLKPLFALGSGTAHEQVGTCIVSTRSHQKRSLV